MSVDVLFREYVGHRNFGWGEIDALELVRTSLEALPTEAQRKLVALIDAYEKDAKAVGGKGNVPLATDDIHALLPAEMIDPDGSTSGSPESAGKRLHSDEAQTTCPKCGMRNKTSDVLCTRCGFFIQKSLKPFKTVRLHEAASQKAGEYFDASAQLVLHLRHINERLYVRPQDHEQPLVMGRSDENTQPDIDLATLKSLNHGVSRRHLAIGYDAGHHVITACDLNSSNGSFINGQRLFPKEVRILRDNDELRLGKLLVGVYFERQFARS